MSSSAANAAISSSAAGPGPASAVAAAANAAIAAAISSAPTIISSTQLKRCILKKHDAPRADFMKLQQNGSWTEQMGCSACRAHRRALELERNLQEYANVEPWLAVPATYTPVAWGTAHPANTQDFRWIHVSAQMIEQGRFGQGGGRGRGRGGVR